MPVVTMPDGSRVDMPENLTQEQEQRLRALVAHQHSEGVTKQEEPAPRDMKSETAFATGNVNKGIASALGAPVDIAQDVLNLGKAAVGTAAIAAGRKDLAPEVRDDAVGGSKWFEHLMASHRMLNEEAAKPRTTGEKIAAAGLQMGGNVLGGAAGTAGAVRTASKVENLVKRPPLSGIVQADKPAEQLVRDLRKEGYKFSPSQVNPTVTNKMVEGVGGKVKTAQDLSIHNQDVHDLLARKALHVSPNTPLTEQTLGTIRNEAYATYDKVRGVPGAFPLDAQYTRGVQSLNGEFSALEAKMPGLTKSPEVDELKQMLLSPKVVQDGLTANEAVDLSRLLRSKATANFRVANSAVGGNPEKLAIAQAQRDAADLVEDLISRNLSASGKKKLYEDWVDARRQLAISHDVEAALNPDTGHVDAKVFAALARKGRPLSGPLETIAKFARAFPKDAQSPAKIGGVPQSVMDILLASAGAGAGGAAYGPEGAMAGSAAGAAIRPAARGLMLSDLYQDRMVVPKK